jgi:hypothetical protein
MTKPRNWTPYPLVTPSYKRTSPVIDPSPVSSRAKTCRITGKGNGDLRASDKEGVR